MEVAGAWRSFRRRQQLRPARPEVPHEAGQPLHPESDFRPRIGHRHPLHQRPAIRACSGGNSSPQSGSSSVHAPPQLSRVAAAFRGRMKLVSTPA
jgi:hypothetical protein